MHVYLANPARFLRIARRLTPWLFWLGVILAAGAAGYGLFFGPAEQFQGESVRIIYLHVPAAWLGVGGWTGIAVASFIQLVWRHPLSAVTGRALAVPGAVFSAICLATGSLWGKPTWGTYWQWDGRMTSMLVLLFLYFALAVKRKLLAVFKDPIVELVSGIDRRSEWVLIRILRLAFSQALAEDRIPPTLVTAGVFQRALEPSSVPLVDFFEPSVSFELPRTHCARLK